MRQIRLPQLDHVPDGGAWVAVPVIVDWPELQLTTEQHMANAMRLR